MALPASTALLSTSTRMPNARALAERSSPASSVTLAPVSSKRTPLTMIEPKPVIVPWVKALAVADGTVPDALLPAASPPPPPPPHPATKASAPSASQAPSLEGPASCAAPRDKRPGIRAKKDSLRGCMAGSCVVR